MAYDFKVGEIYYNLTGSSSVAVTYKVKPTWSDDYPAPYSGDIEIPSAVKYNNKSYAVTSIGDYAFSRCEQLTSITIPESVTSIGGWAFSRCEQLTSITIPEGVTSISDGVFRDCSGLTTITIPERVTSIGYGAFWGCSGLTSITIPESVTSIDAGAFIGCFGLTSITIPEGVTSIGGSAFSGCSSLTSITIPKSVTSIGYQAFGDCSGLTSITLPESVTSIGESAFLGCSSLTSITIPEGVTSIGDDTFSYCSSLTSITLPKGVTSIGRYAFRGCTSLTSITIPEGVTSIGDDAFQNCSGLTSITIPEGVTSIGEWAFSDCSGLTSITIPERVTSIGNFAFYLCSGLTSVLCKSMKPASCDGSVFSSYQPRLIIPVGSEEAYASAKVWYKFTNRSVFKTFDHAVTTFADAKKIDLDNAYQVGDEKTFAAAATKDLKAYQFTGSAVNGTIYGTEVKGIVPAGTGLLMSGTEGTTYVFPLTRVKATADVSENKLVGVTEDTDLSTLTDGNSHYVYDNDGFRLQSTGTIAANKAYLSLPTSDTDKINVSLGGATGIKGIAADNEDNGAWYTLDGAKVNEKPTAKGLYIHNGKKVIVNK
jgi:hypothetical protein